MTRPAFSIYDASAGAGKTYTLVREYLKIILSAKEHDAYRRILAITFTNKAVFEMKSRIVGSLSAFASDATDTKTLQLLSDLSKHTGISEPALREKSRSIIRHIIHNYAAFDISTIDKFTHRVIRTFAHDLNLPSMFDVSLDTENLLTEAVDALIAKAGEDPTLTKLLIDFTMEKADDDKSWDISREIMETGRMILNENNRNELEHFHERPVADFIAIRAKLLEAANCLEDDCTESAGLAFALLERHGVDLKSFSAGHFPNHLASIRDKKYNPKNKRYFSSDDIRINKTARDQPTIEAIVPELLEVLAKVYTNYEKRDFYHAFLKNLTPLSLLSTVSRELKRVQEEQNVLSISEFNKIINDEIRNQPAPFIYERMGERYRHFFIDEFQDTSEMQWQNLVPLIDNATSSEDLDGRKGSLLIVGDPKQSIYRWRGGKAEQFIELGKGNHPFNNKDFDPQSLDTNYRSHAQVIEFNNEFFAFIAGEFENADYKKLYAENSRQKTTAKSGGFVSISFVRQVACDEFDDEPKEKVDLYLDAVLEKIAQSLDLGFSLKDIAVLTRKRDHGIAVAKALTEKGIKIISSETLLIESSAEVRFIINVLKFLRNDADAQSKAAMLAFIASDLQQALPIHDFIFKGLSLSDEKLTQWLTGFGFEFSFSDVRRKSLYEAVEMISARFLKEQSNGYVQYFLDIVLERDLKAQAGIADFLYYWDKNSAKFSIPSPDNTDAVRIMTIHKSKGLEFPVVIFPFAEENYGRNPKERLWMDADESIFGLPKIIIDNSKAVEYYGAEPLAVYNKKKQEELLDNINVLYVALTRAEQHLHIISSMNLTKDGDSPANCTSGFLINFLQHKGMFDEHNAEYRFGIPDEKAGDEKVHFEPETILRCANPMDISQVRIAQRESLMWGTSQQDAIEYGNVIHELLSFVNTITDIDTAIERGLEDGLISDSQRDEVRNTLMSIVQSEALADYFSLQNKVLNEQAIIQKESGIIKPDRIAISIDGSALLLDYKTGAPSQKHVQQLTLYHHAIESMGIRVSKKALVYIGREVNVINL